MLFIFLNTMRLSLCLCLSLCLFFLLASCSHPSPQDNALLARADSLMETHPDSALIFLKHIPDSKRLSSSGQALYALLMSRALDKNDMKVQSYSLIRVATDYYQGGKEFYVRDMLTSVFPALRKTGVMPENGQWLC